jgi:hypothetical protein
MRNETICSMHVLSSLLRKLSRIGNFRSPIILTCIDVPSDKSSVVIDVWIHFSAKME